MFADPVTDVETKPAKAEKKPKAAKEPKPPKLYHYEKVLSERTGKYYCRYEPAYYRAYYYRRKRDQTCEVCGALITSQMSHHINGKKCMAAREIKTLKERIAELEDRTANLEIMD